jgi:enterochelin esterase-like enzyme
MASLKTSRKSRKITGNSFGALIALYSCSRYKQETPSEFVSISYES